MFFKLIILVVVCFSSVSLARRHASSQQTKKPTADDNGSDRSTQCQGSKCQDQCGKIFTQNNLRIHNGVEAVAHSWPAIAYIFIDYQGVFTAPNGTQYYGRFGSSCDGSLIDRSTVLTAAHCFPKTYEDNDVTYELELKPSMVSVYLGYHNISAIRTSRWTTTTSSNSQDGVKMMVASFKVHEEYDGELIINDIALIKLDGQVTLSNSIQLACLPSQAGLPDDHSYMYSAYLAGWGRTETNDSPDTLMNVKLYIYDHNTCQQAFRNFTENQICAVNVQSTTGLIQDACQGDSGGALYVLDSTDSHYYVAGIVSYGSASCNYYGVYTRVSNYLDWIEQNRH